jgi:hypothetical protein
MTRWAVLATLLLVSPLAACSGSASTIPTSTVAGSAAATPAGSSLATSVRGAIAGTVRMYGGPISPDTKKPAMDGQAVRGFVVPVRSGSKVVVTGISDEVGRFRILLAPGRYVLGCGSVPFTIVARHTVTLDCDVNVA